MKLSYEGLKDRAAWEKAGVRVPDYDWEATAKETLAHPVWVHFGSGSLVRAFHARLQQSLLEQGLAKSGIICAETFDYEIVDKVYDPYDNLAVMVSLKPDGSTEKEIVASVAKGLRASHSYPEDEGKVSFPWTMIDKITPRPAEVVEKVLNDLGIEDMAPVVTAKKSFVGPFVNSEIPQYLVVEDRFPNGRPPLEKAGVYLTDRDTVNDCERMKVTTCLNPLHTALAVYGCLLGYTSIAAEMKDPELKALVEKIGYTEGMPVVVDPKILSPDAFIHEVVEQRFPNPFIPDTPQRIATDTSQKVGIRFGETIKSYVNRPELDVKSLTFIPLAIAGWIRYLLAVDDEGKAMELSGDPMMDSLQKQLEGVKVGDPESLGEKIRPILSNEVLFGSDLMALGLGEKIEAMVKEELAGPGAVRETLRKYLKS
ncbi:MAG: mannitol dehydrogenase family protein [Oscillibacter sp.]|nr:mannitol dehydrogenase family protein [Oscillibacter sp.]